MKNNSAVVEANLFFCTFATQINVVSIFPEINLVLEYSGTEIKKSLNK